MMMSLGMGSSSSSSSSSSFNQQSSHGITDVDPLDINNSSWDVDDDEESSSSTVESSDSDLFGGDSDEDEEDVNSSNGSSPASPSGSSSSSGPLQNMSSLFEELPIKRGLSKHYNGKSQSFTSLANAMSVEDLAKPENPYNKRLKSCKSYGGLLEMHRTSQPHRSASSSRLISKKPLSSSSSCSSSHISGVAGVRRNGSFLGNNRPPIPPPHRSTSTSNFTNQTPLFA